MPSQFGSRIEYLIPTDNILLLLLHSNLKEIPTFVDGLSIKFIENSDVAYFFGPPRICHWRETVDILKK